MGTSIASDDALCTTKRDILTLLSERSGRPLSIAQLPDGVQGSCDKIAAAKVAVLVDSAASPCSRRA